MTRHDKVHSMLHQQGLICLPEALHLLVVTWGGDTGVKTCWRLVQLTSWQQQKYLASGG
jgi:hypothetical protein